MLEGVYKPLLVLIPPDVDVAYEISEGRPSGCADPEGASIHLPAIVVVHVPVMRVDMTATPDPMVGIVVSQERSPAPQPRVVAVQPSLGPAIALMSPVPRARCGVLAWSWLNEIKFIRRVGHDEGLMNGDEDSPPTGDMPADLKVPAANPMHVEIVVPDESHFVPVIHRAQMCAQIALEGVGSVGLLGPPAH